MSSPYLHRIIVLCLTLSVVAEVFAAANVSSLRKMDIPRQHWSQELPAPPLQLQLDHWSVMPAESESDQATNPFRSGTLYAGEGDLSGLKRDTAYFMGMQVSILGLLFLAPERISGWSDDQVDAFGFGNWRENVTEVQRDSDRWWINYILHPYWGGTYFTRARERNFNREQAFWYSVLLSSLYEFGGEALFEEPSIQDLIVTPVAGTIVGFWFEDVRSRIHAPADLPSTKDTLILAVTDPLGVVSRYADDFLGIDNLDMQLGFVPTHGTPTLMVTIHW